MDELTMISLMRQAVWTAVLVSSPILAVALAVGLAIGLLQALTSIQELTLTFVPKLAAIIACSRCWQPLTASRSSSNQQPLPRSDTNNSPDTGSNTAPRMISLLCCNATDTENPAIPWT